MSVKHNYAWFGDVLAKIGELEMLSETIRHRLTERFSAPLPDFHKRRIVFWRDEDCEFAEEADKLVLHDVTIVILTGSNNFSVKKLLASDDFIGDYLI